MQHTKFPCAYKIDLIKPPKLHDCNLGGNYYPSLGPIIIYH